jgi:outer membrane protein assembly factor BamD
MSGNRIHQLLYGVVPVLLLAAGCSHKYENPITKDTQQPDKVLFDTAIDDIEHGRYERARLTLQTMMNTYDTSEYLAKAKLAVADSWKREGGGHGMAQAEAEYKDFILFYPNMEESAEAQYKICEMQYLQMDKSDRDNVHARLGDAECKDVLEKWPNSQFATAAADMLRKIQETIADGEMKVGLFYVKKGGNGYFAGANRFDGLVRQYPLYSGADEALWQAAGAYNQMGDQFENQQVDDYARIVRDYPLSLHAEEARKNLRAMGRPVPDADPVAEARMKFELENRKRPGFLGRTIAPFIDRPDTWAAAKSGNPESAAFKPGMPLDVPEAARGNTAAGTESTVTINTPTRDILNTAPDARAAAGTTPPASGDTAADKSADKPAAPNATNPLDATPSASGSAPASSIAVTAPSAQAAYSKAAAKKAKQQKAVAPKRRPRPADRKGTAPAPATSTAPAPSAPSATTSAPVPAAKPSGSGGGGIPQL